MAVCQAQDSFFQSWTRDNLFHAFMEMNIGFMSWGTLEKGILTGRVTPDRTFDDKDVRSHAPWWTSVDHQPYFETMARLNPLLAEQGHSGLELALSHVLSSDVSTTALCGARSVAQVEGLVAATERLLSEALLTECHEVRRTFFPVDTEIE